MVLPIFSARSGIVIDYMHGLLLGVAKSLLTLWFDVSEHKNYYAEKKSYPDYFIGHEVSITYIIEKTESTWLADFCFLLLLFVEKL